MFIYLSKKIAIPNNTKLNCISWNKDDGFIAVGGDDGLLKVLKLDSGSDLDAGGAKCRGLAAASNLSMNQTLEGHTESIRVITWNEAHKKLTTSDQNGVIIVWMLYKGAWYEEMINNRKKSTVVGMSWSADGLKICIIYEDGAVIVGSVDGNRIWGKELKGMQLAGVQWAPDGKLLVFSLQNGQVHLYDNQGNFVMRIEIHCLQAISTSSSDIPVVGLEWYNGRNGLMHAMCPCLAICYENGRMQLMCNESDPTPIIVETGMTAVSCTWNHNGSLIAVAGRQIDETGKDKESNVVQFYSPFGDHMRTLKVPGQNIAACVWEGGSLRVALAVDTFVYFANIRPDYKWCYFKKTVVYTSCRQHQQQQQQQQQPIVVPNKSGISVSFWDTTTGQCHTRFLPVLLAIAGFGDHCVLVTTSTLDHHHKSGGETAAGGAVAGGQYGLLLCNTLGTPVDGKYVDIETHWVTMNATHVIAASKENFMLWQYRTPKVSAGLAGSRGKCRLYHVDDNPSGAADVLQDLEHGGETPINRDTTNDPICALTCSERALIVGRESGSLQHYALPHVALFHRYRVGARPHKLALNCNSTRLSVIDIAGVLTVLELNTGEGRGKIISEDGEQTTGKLERKDVWAMCWAADNPLLFAIMEKTRMYIFKGIQPEEPISSSGYICSFHDLEIQAVLLDDIMETPDKPSKDHLIQLEVKSLRDTRQLLDKVGITEATQFIEDNPHPRLWRLLAEAALKQMNLPIAESAFIRSLDYSGILFIKKLQGIGQESIRKALIATYFKQFDDAEKYYVESDRRDLALILRQTLGDWFRVIQIMKNGVSAPDLVLEVAYNSTAEYFAQYSNWAAAVEYYELAKNKAEMIECYYHLEDYDALQRMIDELPAKDPLLQKIGDMFAADAVYTVAVAAYTKLGNIKSAVDMCVLHNKWDAAVSLAQQYDLPEIANLFLKYTTHLVDRGLVANAIEINVQAKQFHTAAELVRQLATTQLLRGGNDNSSNATGVAVEPTRMKQLYVYAARLLTSTADRDGELTITSDLWRGAEAYHYLILVQHQLYAEQTRDALYTAVRLQDYGDYIDDVVIYSTLALAACQNSAYELCSKAFIKLKTLELNEVELENCQKLAVEIFNVHKPVDILVDMRNVSCFNCSEMIAPWQTSCPACNVQYTSCTASGKSFITDNDSEAQWTCATCLHAAVEPLMTFRKSCPLCHSDTGL